MGGFTSGSHWLIVLAIVVLLFGAKKIPELAKGVGQGIRNFKKEMKDEEPTASAPTAQEAPKQVDATATTTAETQKTTPQA